MPLSSSFQASKCVIKAKDPRLHWISVIVPGFLTTDPIPKGLSKVPLPPQYTTKEATSSHLVIKEKAKEIVDVSDSEDVYEVFNEPQSLEVPTSDLGHLFPTQAGHNQE